MKSNGIQHTKSTPYHPASNGEAERFVRSFKESMKASKYENLPLSHKFQDFLLTYRTTPHSTTNVAPCELFLGRSVRTRLDLLKPNLQEHVEAKQAKQKEQHDAHAKCPVFKVDQNVMVKNRQAGPSWIPGKIMQQVGPLTFLVDVYADNLWKCHVHQLKNYHPPSSNSPEQASAQNSETDLEEMGDAPIPTTPVSGTAQPPSPPMVRRASECSRQRPDYYGH